MSRIEDDRNEQRIAQQKQLQRQQDEAKARERKTGESTFAQRMAQPQAAAAQQKTGTGGAYDSLLDQLATQEAQVKEGGKETLGRSVLKQATSAFQEKLQGSKSGEGEKLAESRVATGDTQAQTAAGRSEDARGTERTFEGRSSDSKSTEDSSKGKGTSGASASREEKLKTGADGGGGKGSGGSDQDPGGNPMGAGFRFNPALMAPVPVAKARDTATSDRIRRVAQEIAQKIVENVRVGTNAKGQAEFQIDLRSNVLSGLSIKLSGGNGKISASFSGSDKEVLKMLEENREGLSKALSGRGLTLTELKIEAKA